MRWSLLTLSLSMLALPAAAAPTLDPLFGDQAVLQRDRPILVTGTAAAGETVTATLGTAQGSGRAGPDGRFAIALPALPAGGPFTLALSAPSGTAQAHDILAGDVFLCSGQSNMELQVQNAQDAWNQSQVSADDKLRLMTVAKATALAPRADFAQPPAWVLAGPETVRPFSAACYYMVQDLRKRTNVPIGAINSSWGGTQISSWMGEAAQRAAGRGVQADLLRLYASDPAAAARQAGLAWEDWWRRATGDKAGAEPWQPDARLDWKPVPKIDFWEHWGVPELAAYDGMVWFRQEVNLTPAQARQGAILAIGPVDDMDMTWMNGVPVGSGGNPGTPREYRIAPGVLHPGRNVLVVNAHDVYANGGMPGPAEIMKLTLADGTALPLGAGWRYAIERRTPSNQPRVPWDDVAGAGVIYNAMIAPLGRFGLKGVAWYQGESDTELPGYDVRLGAMMADWRRQLGAPALPFAIVQLANYGAPATRPGPSGWAQVREAQRLAAERDGHAAIAVTIDLGDPLDIHPGEKHEVGRRLARVMEALAYANPAPPSGPRIEAARRLPDGGIELTFTGLTGALHTRSSDRAIGFELCGETEGSCRYASGRAEGDRVVLAGDGRPVTRVRYAWADSPTVNLFDEAPLPAGPFEVGVP
ncbi:MAG TPA: sialate O-acetylesterase [Allosphingosinicella sp.]|jgi:sialate O-acetylesterase|nr:sialate O-acetylesterase [Allosphingosinicella sp.]